MAQVSDSSQSDIRTLTQEALPKITHVVRNKDFRVLDPSGPDNPEYVDVLMFFWYGSPWSAQVDPVLRQWIEEGRAPSNVRVQWVPVVLDKDWAFAARIYFTLDEMRLQYALSPKLFRAVSNKQVDLKSPISVKRWLEREGVSISDFEETINSPRVIARTNGLVSTARRYQVRSTPTFVIDGRYHIAANEKMSPTRAVAVAIFMAEQLSKGGPRP